MTFASHTQASQPYLGRSRNFRTTFNRLAGVATGGSAVGERPFGHLVLLALTTLLVWVLLADVVGPTAPPLICAILLGCYYLSLTIRSDLAQRAVIKRRLAASRAQLLRRLERL